jgi:hypothetical protein
MTVMTIVYCMTVMTVWDSIDFTSVLESTSTSTSKGGWVCGFAVPQIITVLLGHWSIVGHFSFRDHLWLGW